SKGNPGDGANAREYAGTVPSIIVDYYAVENLVLQHQEILLPPGEEFQQNFLRSKYIEAIEYDIGSFCDDPTVIGVIVDRERMTTYGGDLTYDEYARINRTCSNADYDLSIEEVEYDDNGNAAICQQVPVDSPSSIRSRIVCDEGGICSTTAVFTVQYGLPIRHFGCNSAAGTATNPYMCLGAWLSVNTNVGYNHQLQYAAPLE